MKKITLLLLLFTGIQLTCQSQTTDQKPNVLFIAVDDLKPLINSFGHQEVKTPNLDRLAKSSTIFTSSYCQQAVCAPSRASLLTGLRPDKTEVWDLKTKIRDRNPNILTIPQYFKENGYVTSAVGKVFDPRSVDNKHDEVSWSVPYKKKVKFAEGYENPVMGSYHSQERKDAFEKYKAENEGNKKAMKAGVLRDNLKISTSSSDVPDNAYFDGAMALYARKMLKKASETDEPFFMAVGFKKPHLPFVAPQKYWDMYNREDINLAEWQKPAVNSPEIAYHNSGELRGYNDIAPLLEAAGIGKNDPLALTAEKQRELIHGYYACVSYIDAQVGVLLKALEKNGLDENTVVVLWGDHGWHLGDHNLWCKHSNLEQAVAAPLLIKVPGMTQGEVYDHPTEFVDIFPTLCEVANLEIPEVLDGTSLVPALKSKENVVKEYAISQYPRQLKKQEFMGYSIKKGKYRYTEWLGPDFTTAVPFSEDKVYEIELFDLEADPHETLNIVKQKDLASDLKDIQSTLRSYYAQQYETSKNRTR